MGKATAAVRILFIRYSLCNLCVLCVSVVSGLEKRTPQRHREHRGDTEKANRILLFAYHELQSAKTAVATLVIDHGFEQVNAPEIGPESFGDVDLAVSTLPEQEV